MSSSDGRPDEAQWQKLRSIHRLMALHRLMTLPFQTAPRIDPRHT
jgi:hypothetical protein